MVEEDAPFVDVAADVDIALERVDTFARRFWVWDKDCSVSSLSSVIVAGLREPRLSIVRGTRPEGRFRLLMFMRSDGVAGIRSGLTFVVVVLAFDAAEDGGPDGTRCCSELCMVRGIERSPSLGIDIECIWPWWLGKYREFEREGGPMLARSIGDGVSIAPPPGVSEVILGRLDMVLKRAGETVPIFILTLRLR